MMILPVVIRNTIAFRAHKWVRPYDRHFTSCGYYFANRHNQSDKEGTTHDQRC